MLLSPLHKLSAESLSFVEGLKQLLFLLDNFALSVVSFLDFTVGLHLLELERAAQVAILANLHLLLDLFTRPRSLSASFESSLIRGGLSRNDHHRC